MRISKTKAARCDVRLLHMIADRRGQLRKLALHPHNREVIRKEIEDFEYLSLIVNNALREGNHETRNGH